MTYFKQSALNVYLFILVCLLILVREPWFFLKPRIWAEEGSVYIQTVLENGVFSSLLLPHLGYYSLFNNLVASLGVGLLGLRHVPYVTTIFSASVMVAVLTFPLVFDSKYWQTSSQKILVVLFSTIVASVEVWLNTINSQFYLGLFACYVLIADTSETKGWRQVYLVSMIALGCFTGITTIVLAPFFVFKFWRGSRTTVDKVLLFLVFLGSFLQLGALTYLKFQADGVSRFDLDNLQNLPSGILRTAGALVPGLSNDEFLNLFVLPIGLILLARRKDVRSVMFPLLMAVYLWFVYSFLSLEMGGGARYGFVPAVIFFLFLLSLYHLNLQRFYRILLRVYLIAMIANASAKFFHTESFYNRKWIPYSTEQCMGSTQEPCEIVIFPQWGSPEWRIRVPDRRVLSMD